MPLPRRTHGLRWYFDHNDGRLIHKVLHYFPVYEQHITPFRGKSATMLEIGVSHGGSLQMWRHHLGRRSTIVGVDINPRVAALAEPGIELHIGDQSDPGFLDSLIARYGRFDIVLDDGSHLPGHQIASIERLWPHVVEGGIYIVEDVLTNYWPSYGGGRGRPDTFIAWLHARIDDMHADHSQESGFEPNEWTRTIESIHVVDSIVVLRKTRRDPLQIRKTGRPSFGDVYGVGIEKAIDDEHRAQLSRLNRPVARLRRISRDPVGALRRVARRFR